MASRYRLTDLRTREGYLVYVGPKTGDVAMEDWGCCPLVPVPEEQERGLAATAAANLQATNTVVVAYSDV